MKNTRLIWPFVLPVAAFALTIFIGTLCLWSDFCQGELGPINFIDALFVSTSSVCVTGLSTVDISQAFNRNGHVVMMVLMQLGGLGIATYSTLFLYLMTKRISLTDRLAVGQALLNNQSFNLGRFLIRIVFVIMTIEFIGFVFLYLMEPERIGLFKAAYLAISAFCNAGFALWSDNLESFQQHVGVNTVVMLLISFGGIGFAVIDEVRFKLWQRARKLLGLSYKGLKPLSFSAKMVLQTSAVLTFGGAVLFFLSEYFINGEEFFEAHKVILPSLFQSVTCRTAGFATVSIGRLTDLALLLMIALMFIGGSPGSCAGGIKTTGLRVFLAFCRSAITGRKQVVIGNRAVSGTDVAKFFTLLTFSLIAIITATLVLAISEGAAKIHGQTNFQVLDILYEVVSAFATVGLSTGITADLSSFGKTVISLMMFIGRLGPIWLISTMRQFQSSVDYRLPETPIAIG